MATGIAFDREGNLYVGDRSGTVFKMIATGRFLSLPCSSPAYRLITWRSTARTTCSQRRTTSSFDSVHRIDPHGEVSVFYRGLGRPQGLAFECKTISTWRLR